MTVREREPISRLEGAALPIERGVVFHAAGSTWLAQERPWDAGGQIGEVVRAYEVMHAEDEFGCWWWCRLSDDLVAVRVIDETGRPVKVVDRC